MEAIRFNPLSIVLMAVMIIYVCLKRIPLWLRHKAWAYFFLVAVIATWALRLVSWKG